MLKYHLYIHGQGLYIMAFNVKFKQLRQSKLPPLTQTDLANVLGMTQRKISFLETGVTEPSLKDLQAICLYFNVSADYLIDLPEQLPYIND